MTTPSPEIKHSLARAGLYRMLSLGFSYPKEEVMAEFRRVLELHVEETTEPELKALLVELAAADLSGLENEYLHQFDMRVACSPYESEYGDGDRSFTKSRDLADISGFYSAFGLQFEGSNEPCDHLKLELEFMSVLALKEAFFLDQLNMEGLEVTRSAQHSFLRDHLGRWIGQFCDQLAKTAVMPFYQLMGRTVGLWVSMELNAMNIEPLPIRNKKDKPTTDLEDCLTCPMAGQ